jgi:hypothetical protein
MVLKIIKNIIVRYFINISKFIIHFQNLLGINIKKDFFFFNHKRYVRFKDRRDFKNNYISLKYKNISQLNFLTNLNISFFFNSNLNSFNNFDYIYMYIYNNSFNISNILINFINSLFFF